MLRTTLPVLIFALTAFNHSARGAESWDDFDPPEDAKYDWIQLTSGEWLKGDFKVMYDYVIEFDSDELDLQEFDLDDVKELRTRNPQTVRVETGWRSKEESLVRGQLTIKDNRVSLTNGETEKVYKRSQIVAIADGVERERDFWSGSVSVGITARAGNTDSADMTTMVNVKRRKAASRFLADYIGN